MTGIILGFILGSVPAHLIYLGLLNSNEPFSKFMIGVGIISYALELLYFTLACVSDIVER